MNICGFYDFGWKDLHTPTPKRFRCQLSAAINMAKFREDQLKLYAELNEPVSVIIFLFLLVYLLARTVLLTFNFLVSTLQRSELLSALEEVNEENSQLNHQLASAQMDSNDKMREMEVVELECEELEVEIGRNNKVQTAKREQATELKKKHNELKDELATAKLALQEVQADYESLRNKVVSSPDRRKHDLGALQEMVNEERDEAKSLEEEWQKTKTVIVQVSQAIKDVPETTRLVQEVLEGTQKISQIQDEVQSARTEKETISKETNEIQEQVEGSEASLHRSEEKLAHARKQYKRKMDAAQEALDLAKDQLLDVEEEHSQGTARVEAGEAEVKAMEARIEEERERAEAEIEDMIAQYKTMELSVLDQNAAFMAAIQAS
jgi:chromosome segregation ATPase